MAENKKKQQSKSIRIVEVPQVLDFVGNQRNFSRSMNILIMEFIKRTGCTGDVQEYYHMLSGFDQLRVAFEKPDGFGAPQREAGQAPVPARASEPAPAPEPERIAKEPAETYETPAPVSEPKPKSRVPFGSAYAESIYTAGQEEQGEDGGGDDGIPDCYK